MACHERSLDIVNTYLISHRKSSILFQIENCQDSGPTQPQDKDNKDMLCVEQTVSVVDKVIVKIIMIIMLANFLLLVLFLCLKLPYS